MSSARTTIPPIPTTDPTDVPQDRGSLLPAEDSGRQKKLRRTPAHRDHNDAALMHERRYGGITGDLD